MWIDQLGTAPFLPFSIAGGVLLALVALELLTALIGKPASALVDHVFGHGIAPLDGHAGVDHADAQGSHGLDDLPAHARGTPVGAIDWLNVGRVPALVLLMLLLAAFAVSGFFIQGLTSGVIAPLPWPLAAVAAGVVAVFVTRRLSRMIGSVMPRDETYVVDTGTLVGLTGIVTLGPARVGVVAKARFRDRHGNTHFPRVEPFDPVDVFAQGEAVLGVEVRGNVLAVTRAAGALANESN